MKIRLKTTATKSQSLRAKVTIWCYRLKVFIDGGSGSDYITSTRGNVSIFNHGANLSIESGAGYNYINNSGVNPTLSRGAGDDYFANFSSSIVLFNYSRPNVFIYPFNSTSSLQILSGSLISVASNGNVSCLKAARTSQSRLPAAIIT